MKKNYITTFTLLAILIIITFTSTFAARHIHPQKHLVGKTKKGVASGGASNNGNDTGGGAFGGIFGPGSGFNIPGLGGGVFGGGFGSPKGGVGKGGVIRSSVVCKDKGPCLGKKLICPAKCYKSYSSAGKGYGFGGGSGGCTMDCKKKCVAYC
ncbi:glycine-rich cell wall structural protein 1.0-like [Solanum dulcamara]|uniref:glycine-rich cell wall structural protein 1.0-like n=1 Tax=Solanum dulcamara TaxID=45834 RepID=UPI002485E149|nr:glycine-rich cell wall structural protein 1.0-like [Solanum dulcamara]